MTNNSMNFVRLKKDDIANCEIFRDLMHSYTDELEEHNSKDTPKEIIEKWINSIIDKLDESGRYIELCYANNDLIGFLFGKVDQPHHKGYEKIGYGYIMEFFVLKQHRRKKYGSLMFLRLQELFKNDGINKLYLTADPITGVPFWESLGFTRTDEILPENNLYIYEKIN